MGLNAKFVGICLVCIILGVASTSLAAPTLSLSWYKNNGYGMGGDVGGQWTITGVASSDVTRVEFYLDDTLQVNDTSTPFSWAFNTGNYSLGTHTIKAVAYDDAGQTATAEATRNFVEYSTDIFWIIIGVIVVVMVIALAVSLYWVRRKEAKKAR